jgi:hypothetical protein
MDAGTPNMSLEMPATGASRGRGVWLRREPRRNTLQRGETIQKSPFSFDYLLSKFKWLFVKALW